MIYLFSLIFFFVLRRAYVRYGERKLACLEETEVNRRRDMQRIRGIIYESNAEATQSHIKLLYNLGINEPKESDYLRYDCGTFDMLIDRIRNIFITLNSVNMPADSEQRYIITNSIQRIHKLANKRVNNWKCYIIQSLTSRYLPENIGLLLLHNVKHMIDIVCKLTINIVQLSIDPSDNKHEVYVNQIMERIIENDISFFFFLNFFFLYFL